VAAGHSIDPTRWQAALQELLDRIAGRFARVEPRRRASAFVRGLLADLPRKNCWTISEHAGDPSPDGMQHLLSQAVWDADAVRDDVRDYVIDHLADPEAVLVIDETGDLKKGTATVGVQRQYTGTAGKIDNAQVAVYLVYAAPAGHAVIDRELYLPKGWIADADRRAAAGVPEQIAFATKPELARVMLERALAGHVPAGWVTADEVYGGNPRLRSWLETHQMPSVLAIRCAEVLQPRWGPPTTATALAQQIPPERWLTINAGDGVKGRRWYAWTQVELATDGMPAGWAAGCSSAAACQPVSWPSTVAPARPTCRWPPWRGWQGAAGGSRRRSRPPRDCAVWMSTRSAAGPRGTGGRRWPCWRTPS
jgi:SRSO17 transposase